MARKKKGHRRQRSRRPRGFFDTLTACIAGVPPRHIAVVGKLLGMLIYMLDIRHRRIVRRNLQFTHPEWSLGRTRALSRRIFQNFGITVLEICQMTCFSSEDILRKVRIRGKKHLLDAIESPKGLIMISGHLGNWEMAHLCLSCYVQKPLLLVVREIESKLLNRWVHRFRSHLGSIILYKKRALRRMARTLHQGKPVGLLIDQEAKRSQGVEVTFFGRTANATPVAALLARRYDCPVLPVFCIREADARLTLIVEPSLTLKRTGNLRRDLMANTQIMTAAVEKAVTAYPEQWFWFHKRWKRHYPRLYPEDLTRRQRRRDKKKARSRKV